MIQPFVFNPAWDRKTLWDAAQAYIFQACHEWMVVPPLILNEQPPHARHTGTGGTFYGQWKPPNKIFVNVPHATAPARHKGYVWSYPGHKTDRTCAGILAHEFGHHLVTGIQCMPPIDGAWYLISQRTAPVTSYEPTYDEARAESLRIFILNPDLLAFARPARYQYITRYLPPLHQRPWREVLSKAPDFILKSAEAFAQSGRSARNRTALT